MGFVNQSDVKNHLSPRERNGKRLYRPVGPTDASGFLGQKVRSPVISEPSHQPNVIEEKASVPKSEASSIPIPVSTVSPSAQE